MTKQNLLRMDNVGIVVESLDEAISFFLELGLKLEGRAMIEGEWAGRVTGLGTQSVEIAMMVQLFGRIIYLWPPGYSFYQLAIVVTRHFSVHSLPCPSSTAHQVCFSRRPVAVRTHRGRSRARARAARS